MGPWEDRLLVERCAAGDVSAWEELYDRHHSGLMAAIGSMMGPFNRDRDIVDEIAARVWYALVANDGALLTRFDPARGVRLSTFLRVVARDEINRHFRTERRRRRRETEACRRTSCNGESDPSDNDLPLDEFLETLTPHERQFCERHLLNAPEPPGVDVPNKGTISDTSRWQLRSRIRGKLRRFLDLPR